MQLHKVIVIDFLTEIFDNRHGYSSLNSARSALSSFLCSNAGLTIGKIPSVIRFMKGVYELKPPIPKYTCICDVNIPIPIIIIIPIPILITKHQGFHSHSIFNYHIIIQDY